MYLPSEEYSGGGEASRNKGSITNNSYHYRDMAIVEMKKKTNIIILFFKQTRSGEKKGRGIGIYIRGCVCVCVFFLPYAALPGFVEVFELSKLIAMVFSMGLNTKEGKSRMLYVIVEETSSVFFFFAINSSDHITIGPVPAIPPGMIIDELHSLQVGD